jgi:hypothetical protein
LGSALASDPARGDHLKKLYVDVVYSAVNMLVASHSGELREWITIQVQEENQQNLRDRGVLEPRVIDGQESEAF